jgi:hypothetical protein
MNFTLIFKMILCLSQVLKTNIHSPMATPDTAIQKRRLISYHISMLQAQGQWLIVWQGSQLP